MQNHHVSFTAIELKNLVTAAQRLDERAINRLCAAFKPLIIVESHKKHIIARLGEDSENIAWEIFLEAIQSYKGNKYHLLPGLIQKRLYFELLHKAYPRSIISVTADLLLDDLEAKNKLTAYAACQATNIDTLVDKAFFAGIFRCLTKKQRDIIDALYLHQMSLAEYCAEQRISYTAAYKLEQRALAVIKRLLNKDVFTNVNTRIKRGQEERQEKNK